jgi:hypothetical protein
MEGVKVVLCPNIEKDYQSLSFKDLGITHFEWTQLSEDDQRYLVLEKITENIFPTIESIVEY